MFGLLLSFAMLVATVVRAESPNKTAPSTPKSDNGKTVLRQIDKNKSEHDAVVAAVKSKNKNALKAVLKRHGLDVDPVLRQNGFCYTYSTGGANPHFYKICCGVDGPQFDIPE